MITIRRLFESSILLVTIFIFSASWVSAFTATTAGSPVSASTASTQGLAPYAVKSGYSLIKNGSVWYSTAPGTAKPTNMLSSKTTVYSPAEAVWYEKRSDGTMQPMKATIYAQIDLANPAVKAEMANTTKYPNIAKQIFKPIASPGLPQSIAQDSGGGVIIRGFDGNYYRITGYMGSDICTEQWASGNVYVWGRWTNFPRVGVAFWKDCTSSADLYTYTAPDGTIYTYPKRKAQMMMWDAVPYFGNTQPPSDNGVTYSTPSDARITGELAYLVRMGGASVQNEIKLAMTSLPQLVTYLDSPDINTADVATFQPPLAVWDYQRPQSSGEVVPADVRGPASCFNSTVNVSSGGTSHNLDLFSVAGGVSHIPNFSLFYDSRDELDITPGVATPNEAKVPLGQGWTHSYDISLYKTAAGVMILRGGGLERRFYTPSGTIYVSQSDDSSVLSKNADGTYVVTHRDGLKYNFTTNGLLTSIVDRFGNATVITRNANSDVTSIADPSGRTILLTISNGRILAIKDSELKQYDFVYDTNGQLAKVSSPADNDGNRPSWSYIYDPTTRMLLYKTDPSGFTVNYAFDTQRRVASSINPDGVVDTLGTTNPDGHSKILNYISPTTTSITKEDGGVWSYSFDPSSKGVATETAPDGANTSYTYNASNRVATITKAADSTTNYVKVFQYDSYGNITDVQGHAVVNGVASAIDSHLGVTYANTNYDQITSVTDYIAGLTTTYTYDTDGAYKRTKIVSPSGAMTTIRRNSNGAINDITFPDGKKLTYVYNASKLLQSVTDNFGIKTEYSNLTPAGRPQTVKIYDAGGVVKATTNITYDNLGRVLTTTLAAGSNYTTTYGYDASGNVTVSTDANNNSTNSTYNYKGQPKQITDALGKLTTIAYSPTLLPASLTDANGNITSFSYNPVGQLIKETPPAGVAIRYQYNLAGQVTQKINDATDEVLVSYTYNPQGQLTGRIYLDGSSDVFGYNAIGRLVTASNQNISYTFAYDAFGRVASQTDNSGNVVSYSYDAAGRRTSLSVNNSHTVNYGYTADRLTSISSNLAGAFGFGYDSLGRRSSLTYPNGIVGTYSYNADQPGWLGGISYTGNLPIYSVTYPTFDKTGNRLSKNEGTPIIYGYDAVYRLLNSSAGEVFTYDNAGNRLTDAARLYTVSAGNVMTAAGTTQYSYDSFGNTITAGAWAYSWNSAGQMVAANNGTTVATYAYDPFGRRISKTINGTINTYIYDGTNIAASVTGGAITYYVHGQGVDEHLVMISGGSAYFYHTDGLGSVTRITDASQNIVQSYTYTSFGSPTASTPFHQPYLFTGREYDTETDLNYHHARYLDMGTGRWLSRDPLGLAAGDVVLTNYVGGNAVNYMDPSGLDGVTTASFITTFSGQILSVIKSPQTSAGELVAGIAVDSASHLFNFVPNQTISDIGGIATGSISTGLALASGGSSAVALSGLGLGMSIGSTINHLQVPGTNGLNVQQTITEGLINSKNPFRRSCK